MLKNELDLSFNYEPVVYKQIKCGKHKLQNGKKGQVASQSLITEKSLCETMQRLYNRTTYFSEKIIQENDIVKTITAGGGEIWIGNTGTRINDEEIINAQTFPQDYDFCKNKVRYICGMSVPPIMIKRVVEKLIEQGVYDVKE